MYLSICLTVKLFSLSHILPILFFAVLGVLSIYVANTFLDEKGKRNLGTFLALVATSGVFIRMSVFINSGAFDFKEELPLHLCRILAILAPFVMYFRNRSLLGILYFAVYAGTLNANLTPDVDAVFPELLYFTYWMMHSALLILPLYAIYVYGVKIDFNDFKRSFVFINTYFVLITFINWVLDSNYFYTCAKPVSKSILDLFGPWPVYILVTYGIGLTLMIIFYLPWYFKNKSIENRPS